MTVVANYISGSESALLELASTPATPAELRNRHDLRVLEIDGLWEAIAWLLSPAKRREQELEATTDDDVDVSPDVLMTAVEGVGAPKEGSLDWGYGPPYRLDASLVKNAASAIQGFARPSLRQVFDPSVMDEHGVYPEDWSERGEEGFNELTDEIDRLTQFLAAASARQDDVLILFS